MHIRVLRTAALLLVIAIPALAGDLNPPPGPVAPTMKTLTEVEPRIPISATTTPGDADSLYRIAQSGSYYLTGNVTGVAGKHGIEVAANDVTIDLRGHALIGVGGSLSGFAINGFFGIVIHDGNISGWGGSGILGDMSGADHFHHLYVHHVSAFGITVNSGSIIEHCRVQSCSTGGISTSNNVVIHNTVATNNGGAGIAAGTASTLVSCEGTSNSGPGLIISGGHGSISYSNATLNLSTGIDAGDGGQFTHCHANRNANGIVVGEAGHVANSTADENSLTGIVAGATSTIVSCSSWNNDVHGISVTAGTVTGCTARENTSDGINVTSGSLVDGCTAASNTRDGIAAGSGCIVTRCTASSNTGDGIQASGDCRISDNNCDNNGFITGDGAGIHITSSDCRIQGNNVTDNDRGIDVDVSGNLVIQNSASGNGTNYEIVANNKVAPILLAPDSLAISGDTGGAGVGTTNPWANLSY